MNAGTIVNLEKAFNIDLANPGNIVGLFWGNRNPGDQLLDSQQILVWTDGNGKKLEVKGHYNIYGRHSPAPREVIKAYVEAACVPEAQRLIDGFNNPPEGPSNFIYALHKVEYSRTEEEGHHTNHPTGHGTNWEGWGDGFCFVYFTKSPK